MPSFRRLTDTGCQFAVHLLARTRTDAGRSFWSGVLAAFLGVPLCHQVTARFGVSLLPLVGAVLAIAFAVLAGGFAARSSLGLSRGWLIAASLVPAVWLIAFPWIAESISAACLLLDLERLASPPMQLALGCVATIILIGIPATAGTWLMLADTRLRTGWVLCGTAAGCLAAVELFGPWCGLQWTGWLAVSWTVAATARYFRSATPVRIRAVSPDRRAHSMTTQTMVASLSVGMLAAGLWRLTSQLFPASESAEWTAWAGFLAGTSAGWEWARRGRTPHRAASQIVLAAAICSVVPFAFFSALTDLSLSVTSSVTQVFLLFLVRGAIVCAVTASAGALWGALIADGRRFDSAESINGPAPLLWNAPLLGAGFVTARWLLPHGVGVGVLIGGASTLAAGWGASAAWRPATRRGRIGSLGTFVLVAAMAAAGHCGHSYNPARAAKLLFSTNVFVAHRGGTEARLLPFLDEGRLIAVVEGDRGSYSLWKHRGVQFQLRRNGIPQGTFCGCPAVCPRFSGEVLPAALPLLLHEAPRRVLILGMGSGTALLASLEFPVAEITCVEADAALIDVLQGTAWPAGSRSPLGDNRVRLVVAEPAWAVQTRSGEFDAIVADTEQAGVSGGTPYFTREFYKGVAGQLAADGIFAQRFERVDFGPSPIRSLLATLRTVFAHVAAVEGGPGELVLLATNSDRGLGRPELLKRFQSPQADRVFTQLGWDWSVALNLAGCGCDGCDALSEGATVNTAANGLFAFELPRETMRWGPKMQEVADALAPHAARIAQWPNVDGKDPDLMRRLSDVVTQRNLMTAYPDQPWAYRKVVREEIKKHPRTVIEDGDEGLDRMLHPLERRRLTYFAALGKAARSARPTADALRQIEEFAAPYDPVMTYFLHHELSVLYARSELAGSAEELRHRLYAVYYSDVRDRSVRDVVEALDLLCHGNEAAAPLERWDHMNALLEFLKLRWINRGLGRPESTRIALNDLEKTIHAAESTFDAMEELCSEAGITPADWHARRDVLERTLVRPLRSYRTELVRSYPPETERTTSRDAVDEARQSTN